MQNDLISRSKLLEDLEMAAGEAAPGQVQAAMLFRDKLAFATDVVKQAEAVDAEPVRHGRWIRVNNTFTVWKCSECGAIERHNCFDYCHCGAKMDAKEE